MGTLFKLVLFSTLFYWKLSPGNTRQIRIPEPIPSSTHDINKMAVDILSQCYADHKEIVIHKNSDRIITEKLQDSVPFNVIVLDDSSEIKHSTQLRLHKHLFLCTPRFVSQLQNTLATYKSTTRWDIMVPFFILDHSNRDCKIARKMLETAWNMDILKSFLLCVNSRGELMIYTYNPYASRAPLPWKPIEDTAIQSQGWTMYARAHQNGNICQNLDFDRTQYLNGTVIRVGITVSDNTRFTPNIDYSDNIIPFLYSDAAHTVKMLKYSWNVTLIFNVGSRDTVNSYLEMGTCDVSLLFYQENPEKNYPVVHFAVHLVTNDRGALSPFEEIKNYFGLTTLISTCVIVSLTFIVILLSKKVREWGFTSLEILRLLINTSLYSRIDTVVLRIFFAAIFVFFFIMQTEFLAQYSAVLAKQKSHINAETLNDLKDPRFNEIYVSRGYEELITDPILRKKFIFGDRDCIGNIIGKDTAACLCEIDLIVQSKVVHELHVSKHPVITYTNYYKTRSDWPLRKKFDSFLKRLESVKLSPGDYLQMFNRKEKERQRIIAPVSKKRNYPISLSILQWAIILFLIGLKLALMSFGYERFVRNRVVRRRQNRLAIRNAVRVGRLDIEVK